MEYKSSVIRLFGIISAFCFVINTVAHETILDGERVFPDSPNQFPYQVTLQGEYSGLICGGGIIDYQFILTAAHCFINDDGKFDDERMNILAGTTDLRYTHEPAVFIEIKKVSVPKDYKPHLYKFTGDIAVVELKYPLDLARNPHLRRVDLPKNKHDSYEGKVALIAGFGYDVIDPIEHGSRSDTLMRYAEVDVISIKKCKDAFKSPSDKISDSQMCGQIKQRDFSRPRGACHGDSGGPLVFDNTVIGILSRNPKDCSERDYPGVYTRVTSHLNFIQYAMRNERRWSMHTYDMNY